MLEYNICYSSDSNYAEQLAVSMASILCNADKQEKINFYILDGGLSSQDKQNIEILKNIKDFSINYLEINEEDFKSCPILKEKDEKYSSYHVTLPTYFRFKLASLLPKIDKILYLDCDVIVRSSLDELYSIPNKDIAALMILDAESKQESKRINSKNYFNAGVMLINLDYWRKNNVEKRLFKYAKENADSILWQDQDVINIVLQNEIKKVSEKWNFQYFLYEKIDVKKLADVKIFHLAGRFKPWLIPFDHPVYNYYYYYLVMTPWKNKAIQYKEMAMGKTLKNNIGGRETNILVNATDADLQKVYSEFDKIYKTFDEVKTVIHNESDLKISKVYEEISKNYEFTKNIVSEVSEKDTAKTDEKISKVYEEISKNYEYTNEKIGNEIQIINEKILSEIDVKTQNSQKETEDKVSKVYEEISKNYEFTKNIVSEISEKDTVKTDEKISKVYEEISKNYEYTNEKIGNEIQIINEKILSEIDVKTQNSQKETEDKVSKVYEEISKNYEFTKNIVSEISEKDTAKTDEKISKVYEEISKNYEYTNEKIGNEIQIVNEKMLSEIDIKTQNSQKETDGKISKVYEEISKNYEFTNEVKDSINSEIQAIKVDIVNTNQEIEKSKNETIEKTTELVNSNLKQLTENVEKNNQLIDSKIKNITGDLKNIYETFVFEKNSINGKLNDLEKNLFNELDNHKKSILMVEQEIKKNSDYFESLVEETQFKLDDKIQNLSVKSQQISDDLNIQKQEMFSAKKDIQILNTGIENLNNDVQNAKKSIENKITDVYSYTNEQMNKAFTEINENYKLVDAKIDKRSYENYLNVQNAVQQIDGLRYVVDNKTDKQELDASLESAYEKIQMLEVDYQNKLIEMRNVFEDELNKQRIKYEKKLIEMENIISSMDEKYQPKKKSIFTKLRERLNNK